ncbi:MAG TPA: 50S ribosomal protein L25 [Gemmataceae bacterium]|jgi:large subunit ribosomal protein L25|nr:50S ribosomal protein L25 [Gemmataceae bacterium]
MESVKLATKPRPGHGSRSAKKLRRDGLIPAVVYGHKQNPVGLAIDRKELETALRHNARVVDLQLDGSAETAVIQEVQFDHLGTGVLHVDFKRVDKDERVRVSVRIELKGVPAGLGGGHVLEQPLHTLHIECPVLEIPDSIRVNVTTLQTGHPIHVKELTLPEGVKAMDDPDLVVVQISLVKVEAAPVVAAAPAEGAAPTTAEPEIVGRRVAKEESEEEK